MANQGFKEFFALLNARSVDFLIIGGVAYNYFAPPRATKDIDVWVCAEVGNLIRFLGALADFGFPTNGLDAAVLSQTDQVLILGRAPNRIDVLTNPGGPTWDEVWPTRVVSDYDGVPVSICNLDALIAMKRHAGRPQDLVDVTKLEQLRDKAAP